MKVKLVPDFDPLTAIGVNVDLASSTYVAVRSIDVASQTVSFFSNVNPIGRHIESYIDNGFTYIRGSIVVNRVGDVSYSGGWYSGVYRQTIDLNASKVTSVGPFLSGFDKGIELYFSKSVKLGSLVGKKIGALIQDRDEIEATGKNDVVKATGRSEIIRLLEGDDTVYARAGNDTIYAGAGNDIINGGAGLDRMYGEAGNDTFYVDDAGDKVVETINNGQDTVVSSINYVLPSHVEDLRLTGSAFRGEGNGLANVIAGNEKANTLSGHAGNDTLRGGGGNDVLVGGKGADLLVGGKGADKFTFTAITDSTTAERGRDTISDFARSHGDRIDLRQIDANTNLTGDQKFKYIGKSAFTGKAGELRMELKNGDTLVYGDVNGDAKADFSILLDSTITLISADFIL